MITSNIGAVIDRLSTARQTLPAKVQSVLRSENYAARMRFIAGMTMDESGLLTDDEKQFVPKLVDTFMSQTLAGSMEFSIHMLPIQTLLQDVDDPKSFLDLIPRQELIDWVANYKDKKGRDRRRDGSTRSDEEIARNVAFAIESNPDPWLTSTDPSGLRMITGLTHFPPEKVSALLKEVLSAWVEYMRETLPGLVMAQVRSAFR